jgi:prepilin-type N-terminal cleavage/methylation domain-containing protein
MKGLIPKRAESPLSRPSRGFTLLEMLVSLIIGTLIIGGVMGMVSVSMQYRYRLNEKRQIQPVLESAAQMILADPTRVAEGSINLSELPGAPTVRVSTEPVDLSDMRTGTKQGQLNRVMLHYKTGELEFSVIIPSKN